MSARVHVQLLEVVGLVVRFLAVGALVRGSVVPVREARMAAHVLQERAPGFLATIHHGNAPKLFRPVNNFLSASKPGEVRVVFEDDRVHYAGQYIAVVVAETLQQGQHAAELVMVTYETWSPVIDTDNAMDTVYDPAEFFGEKLAATRGDPESAFQQAEVTHEAHYVTPIEHHNPMEPWASIAHWDGDELTLYETTQWVVGARNTVAETLGMPEEHVHIVSPFIGGGFGCKGFIWPHSVMSAIAARNQAAVEGERYLEPGKERDRYAFKSWGGHFVEVKVDPDIAKVTVSRVVSAFHIGRVINQKTARSQAYSGIIMGIGMALMEHTVYDHRDGGIITSNLADYAVSVNADVHAVNIHFIDRPDPYIDPVGIGARGAGEIPITGVAPAIANALHHATGKRLRELPITPDKLL